MVEQAHSSVLKEAKSKEDHEDEGLFYRKAWKKIVMGYLRWTLVGGLPGPDTTQTVVILGRAEVLRRLVEAEKLVEEEEKEKSRDEEEKRGGL